MDRGPEKVAVVPHHPVQRLQLQVGLVRVNGHIATRPAATTHMMMVVDVVGTFEWQTAGGGNGTTRQRLIRVALDSREKVSNGKCEDKLRYRREWKVRERKTRKKI